MTDRKKTGLVLEGGGMRGIYTAGVLDVFMEHGITFDGVIGVSAGAIHGCSYISKQKGRSIYYYTTYCGDPRMMSFKNVLKTGDLVDEKFAYHDIPDVLVPYDYDAFNAADTEFIVGCSNLETGKPEYLKLTDMKDQIDYLRASASLPYVSRAVELNGLKLLDGGCTDSIPVQAMNRRFGYRKLVVVQTRERGYRKKSEFNPLALVQYRKYPNFIRALAKRHLMYNREVDQIERWEKEGKIFVIRPEEKLNIGRTSATRESLNEVYQAGRKDAEEKLAAMLEFLGVTAEQE